MKKIIRLLFNGLGYDIVRKENVFALKGGKKCRVKVWNYYIVMPSNNTLRRTYKIYPDFNSHLSRLSIHVYRKYPEMTIVDVGANVGDTIAVLRSVINAPIIAIEGDDISYEYLEENIRQFENISTIKAFLSEKSQELNIRFENVGWNTTIIPANDGEKKISFKTMDEIFSAEKFKDCNVKLIKIDVEGYDTNVLRGASSIIKKNHPILFFEYNPDIMKKIGENGLPTILSFRDYGYDRIAFFDYLGRLFIDTSLKNVREIASLHDYAAYKNNLLGYYDICIFHEQDESLAEAFLQAEKESTLKY